LKSGSLTSKLRTSVIKLVDVVHIYSQSQVCQLKLKISDHK
jgi:hypothetical protein